MKKLLSPLLILSLVFFGGCGSDDEVSFEEQLAIDNALIDNYLLQNNISTQEHESGIRYVIEEQGTGDNPRVGDRIALKFTGTNLEGDILVVDTLGITIDFTEFILRSWVFLLPEVSEGGSIRVFSPSGYAYGANGNIFVGPNEVMIFDLELLAIIDNEQEQLEVDLAIIDEFLDENNITTQVHESGIRYTVIEEGTGDSPSSTNSVSVTYEGTFLSGAFFDGSDNPVSFSLSGLIEAWQIMVPEMKEGGRIKFYAPSRFCYGTNGNGIIGPNTVLVFEIGLEEVL